MTLSRTPEALPRIDELVFPLDEHLPARLLDSGKEPDLHFDPEEAARGVISGRIAVIWFEHADSPGIVVAPAVKVARTPDDPNVDYPHVTHGEMLGSTVCNMLGLPYSRENLRSIASSELIPRIRPGATGKGSRYFRFDSPANHFQLQGRLPRDELALCALLITFQEAFGATLMVDVGEVPGHLYH